MSDAAEKSSQLPPARVIAGRYRVLDVIGEGAQSVVYRARREPEGDTVALKVIHRHLSGSEQVRKRFLREARILRGLDLQGEHIVKLLDVLEEDGLVMIALEHVSGTSLESMLQQGTPLDLDVAIEVALQISAALGVAHANGVIHRDLKPANVLVERQEPDQAPASKARGIRIKVVDFGLGKVLHGQAGSTGLTEQGMIFGTPEYMAPEQARGDEADARSDLYALGVMLYEMTVGEVPFKGRNALSTMTAHLTQPAPSPRKARPDARITPALESVILRALAKDPADRFASARELAEAIAAARDEPLVIAPSGVGPHEAAEMGQGDTDLHLEQHALGQAKTLRADEIAALAASERRAGIPSVVVRATDAPPTKPSVLDPLQLLKKPPNVAILDAPTAESPSLSAPSSGEPSSGEHSPRTGYVWVLVAVVAASIGVAIGVFVGMR